MRVSVAAVFVLLAFLKSAVVAATWSSAVPVTGGATIYGAAAGPDQAVFVGGAGLIGSSADARTWVRRNSGTTATLYGVAYGAGRFVAVGAQGTILSSVDGITWVAERHPYTTPLAPDINGVTFGGGRFVAASRSVNSSGDDNIITSTDGRTWTRRTVDRGGFQMQFIAYANGQYLAGGGGVLMVSSDSVSWRTVWTGASWLYAAASSGSRWVVSGTDGVMLTSSDGNTWAAGSTGQRQTVYALDCRGGRFLGVGSNAFTIPGNNASVFTSLDGVNWTGLPFPAATSLTRNDTLRAMLATNSGYIGFGAMGIIATTSDGTAWSVTSEPPTRGHFSDVTYGKGLFVAVGSRSVNEDLPGINPGRIGAVYTSTDSVNWDEQTSGVRGATLRKIAFGRDRFVAVGPGGTIVYSDDAISWKPATYPASPSFTGVAFGAGRFVAIGRSVLTSTDGITWQADTAMAGNDYWEIRFANGSFFLSTNQQNRAIQRSFDGVNWTNVALANSSPFTDIAFGNGLWVAATNGGSVTFEGSNPIANGALQVSTDGLQWAPVRSPASGTPRSVQWIGDRWVAGLSDGNVLVSTDGRSWRVEERPTETSIESIAFGGGHAVAVGSNHLLLTTRDPSTVPARVSVARGEPLALSLPASSVTVASVEWFKDGVLIPAATQTVYRVAAARESDAGLYTVAATTANGDVIRASFTVTVLASRIINLSIRTGLSPAAPELTVGYVIAGTGKSLLVRAVGPGLAAFGVSPALARPRLGVYAGQRLLATNEGWDRSADGALISSAAARLGAFALAGGSADAALLRTFEAGNHSAIVSSIDGQAGTALVEIYDADTASNARLINVSALARVGVGENTLVAGFVVAGNAAKRVLIRAIGPTLAGFGRSGVLADPLLAVTPAGAQSALALNDNWGASAELFNAFLSVGAFALAGDSKDAAVVLALNPGAYTVQVSGFGGTTGDALVEIYELP